MLPGRALRCSRGTHQPRIQVEMCRDAGLGVEFVLRVATALKAKPNGPPQPAQDKAAAAPSAPAPAPWRNPFSPPEPELTVGPLGPTGTHTAVLNKFNVVAHHVLVITNQFRSQAEPLHGADLAAALEVLQAMPEGGVAFYNCGPESGRSQPHKHLQLGAAFDKLLQLAFPGYSYSPPPAMAALPPGASPTDAATAAAVAAGSVSYNVLMTRQWLLLAPRRTERCGPLALNSLAFAGTILVRSEEELGFVREKGPGSILAEIGVPCRQHASIRYNFDTKQFELVVLGKNGVSVDHGDGNFHLYTPESPPTALKSRDLLMLGEKKFYFLLPRTLGPPLPPPLWCSPAQPTPDM
eukprot:XP_001698183.1 predicted protein [Chlamydomonas reinhardtii]